MCCKLSPKSKASGEQNAQNMKKFGIEMMKNKLGPSWKTILQFMIKPETMH